MRIIVGLQTILIYFDHGNIEARYFIVFIVDVDFIFNYGHWDHVICVLF